MPHNLLMIGILFKVSCPRLYPRALKFSYNMYTILFKEIIGRIVGMSLVIRGKAE